MPAVKARILLVDDETALLATSQEILQQSGFEVTACTSGRAAIRALTKGSFEAVISDVRMPGLDGLGVLRAVRAHDPDLPVVLTTGDPSLDGVSEALDYGALHYLIKPVPLDKLVETARRAVKLCRLARVKRDALRVTGGGDELLIGDRVGLEAAFARALGTLRMAYQPIVSADGSSFGFEALLRCREPLFPHPGALLSAAERLGRLHDLGRVVRGSVSDTVARGKLSGVVFVNLHPLDLGDEQLVDAQAPLSRVASRVVLEVTERARLDNVRDVADRVASLRRIGFRIALDDLGGGYAGLTSFAALVPDIVKVDGELVKGLDKDPIKRRLVGSIVSICKELHIPVVAEGIETAAERESAIHAGCELLQGFLIGTPVIPRDGESEPKRRPAAAARRSARRTSGGSAKPAR
jgi:EAL domain-containing protein (putative c-di-GMP-specific phosphodiesterase class I)/CheY-like chemotaxis protein